MEDYTDFLLNIKLASLKRDQLNYLTFKQLKDVIYHTKWLIAKPKNLSVIAKDINDLSVEEIVDYIIGNEEKIQDDLKKISEEVKENGYEEK